MYASCREFHSLVLVMHLLRLISSSTKGGSNSVQLLHCKMWLKQAKLITNETTLHQPFLARPIHDEDEHSRNDGLISNKEALKVSLVHLMASLMLICY